MSLRLALAILAVSVPVTVQVPGSPGSAGSPGQIGPAGPAGSIPTPVSSYNTGGTNVLATSSAATANGPIFGSNLPQVVLPVQGGNYMLFARCRVDGSAVTISSQTTHDSIIQRDPKCCGGQYDTGDETVQPGNDSVTFTAAEFDNSCSGLPGSGNQWK